MSDETAIFCACRRRKCVSQISRKFFLTETFFLNFPLKITNKILKKQMKNVKGKVSGTPNMMYCNQKHQTTQVPLVYTSISEELQELKDAPARGRTRGRLK